MKSYNHKGTKTQSFVMLVAAFRNFSRVLKAPFLQFPDYSDMRGTASPSTVRKDTNGRIQILLLEDNPRDAELVEATLEGAGLTCDIVCVDTEKGFRKTLERTLDLIISDYSLPSFDGKAALKIARECRPDVPFIFVSGTLGEEAAVDSLLSGATDYVLKHKFARLIPAVQRALREAQDQRARREAEQ